MLQAACAALVPNRKEVGQLNHKLVAGGFRCLKHACISYISAATLKIQEAITNS